MLTIGMLLSRSIRFLVYFGGLETHRGRHFKLFIDIRSLHVVITSTPKNPCKITPHIWPELAYKCKNCNYYMETDIIAN